MVLSERQISDYIGTINVLVMLVTAFSFVTYARWRWATLEFDLLKVTWWLSLHGLLSYLLYLVLPDLFVNIDLGGMIYRNFIIFPVSSSDLVRATGLCWEPGLLQYVANMSLFLGLKYRSPLWKLLVSFAAVVATRSTVGIFVLAPVIVYLLLMQHRSMYRKVFVLLMFPIAIILGATMFQSNIAEKLGDNNTSGLARIRDLQVGGVLIKEKPLLGHGRFDVDYLASRLRIWNYESALFSKEYLASSGNMSGGYTNGFLAIPISYGIPFGVFIYLCLFNNQLIQGGFKERTIFFMISIVTFISEPITSTLWFYTLAISGICRTWEGRLWHFCFKTKRETQYER
jgi:hypothetical protein